MKTVKQLILGFMLIFFLSSLTRNLAEYYKNVKFHKSYKTQYEQKKQENTRLKTQILKKSDPLEVEKTIRNKLNLSRENEIVLMVPDPELPSPTPTPSPLPVYQQWAEALL